MTDIEIARFALAAIDTELERDFPDEEAAQTIASEALELTRASARPGKDLRLDGYHGMESWREYRRLHGL